MITLLFYAVTVAMKVPFIITVSFHKVLNEETKRERTKLFLRNLQH